VRAALLDKGFFSLVVVRMTCVFKGGNPLSFRVRPAGRRGISSFLLTTVAIVFSLGGDSEGFHPSE